MRLPVIMSVLSVAAAVSAAPVSTYRDVMAAAVDAYSPADVSNYLARVEEKGVTEHGFPRLAANMGYLLAHGRRALDRETVRRMLDIACREMTRSDAPGSMGNDFSVKELVLAVVALERAGTYPKAVTDAWRGDLSRVTAANAYRTGRFVDGAPPANNWRIFAAASEQARLRHGMGGDAGFVERAVAEQLVRFDANGMYRDPHCPMTYDFVTRLQFAVVLALGYDGPSRAKLEEMMDRSAEPTLRMLSATGEIPYGGRSNQFLHTATFYAALCEWYAARAAKRGDGESARAFRYAARRSLESLPEWLEETPVRHVRNRYPRDSRIGCEGYAYFDKYMVTMGSWAMLADQLKDDAVAAVPPADERPFVFETGPDFHRLLLSAGDYTAQFDADAQAEYDADGLGRLQRRGAPGALCLSVPCPCNPVLAYRLAETNACPLAILPVVPAGTKMKLAASAADATSAGARWTLGDLGWDCRLTATGLVMTVAGSGRVALALPAFAFDGAEKTAVTAAGQALEISYRGWTCRYETDGALAETGFVCHNRNGTYRRFEAVGQDRLTVRVTLERNRPPAEAALVRRLPDLFGRAAAHYRALDAAAVAENAAAKDGKPCYPHSYNLRERKLRMYTPDCWTGGHTAGSFWHLYEATGDAFFRQRAEEWQAMLVGNMTNDTNHDVGFIMYCSYGNARRLLRTDRYDAILTQTANSLCRRFNGDLGLIRSWGLIEDKDNFYVIPDNLMNLELLEWAAGTRGKGTPDFGAIADSHAKTTMRHHFRADGGCYHVLDYDQRAGFRGVKGILRGQGKGPESSWSRGQAWAIYGYAMMYRETRDPAFLAFAQRCADFAINHPNMPADGVPCWDYGAPGEERDSSAGAIMASALIELSSLVGGEKGAGYRAFAVRQLTTLSSDAYFSQGDEVGHFLLKHGVGHKPGGSEIDVPLNYGDYYYLEALLRLRK